jgi:hypothetical protein
VPPRHLKTRMVAPAPKSSSLVPGAWAAILGFVVLTVGGLAAHVNGLLELLYPLAACAVGVLLYGRYPALYLGFTWWLWFLTPEVRRLVDYQEGWNADSPVMLAPYLVTALTLFTVLRHLPKLRLQLFFPFGLVLFALLCGYTVGVFNGVGLLAVTFDLLNWLVPVAFAFYLMVHWRSYPRHHQVIQRTFVWGVLFMGLYGLLQFLFLPAWDQYWMLNAPMASIGYPEPFQVRMFSTLNAPNPFAVVMMAGLLLLFSERGVLRWLAAGPGYAAFLLSLVRSAWGGWIVGVFFLLVRMRGLRRLRLLAAGVVFLVALLPFIALGPVTQIVNERVLTFGGLATDYSLNARISAYEQELPDAALDLFGEGLGSTGIASDLASAGVEQGGFDSGIINTFITLGLAGTIFYATGMAMLFASAFPSRKPSGVFLVAAYSVAISMLTQLAFFDAQVGVAGMLLWGFLGLTLAGQKHARYDLLVKEGPNEAAGG